jgi:hypothetical protein
MAVSERGGRTAAAASAFPTGPAGGGEVQSRYVGVPDDYVRTVQRRIEDESDPFRRVAPGVIRGRYKTQTEYRAPQYNDAFLNAQFANMPPEEVWLLQQRMARAGFIGPKTRFVRGVWDRTTKAAFRELLEMANTYTTDIDTALEIGAGAFGGGLSADGSDGLGGVEERPPFTGTKTRTDKAVQLSDPTEARRRVRSFLRSELGRSPSKAEYDSFVAALQAKEQASPVVTTTNTHVVEDEVTGSTSTRTGGLDPEGFTEEYVRQNPRLSAERNSFMRDTDYFNAAMSVLGEGGGQV